MLKKICLLGLSASMIFGLISCSKSNINDSSNSGSDIEHTLETVTDEIATERYDYSEFGIEFLSDHEKESWRPDLIAFLSKTVDPWSDDNHQNLDQAIARGYDIGLLDIDLNGTPEVIINYGGGSSGNKYLDIFDLKSHEKIGNFTGGYNVENEWCYFYNPQTESVELFGEFYLREGWDTLYYYIRTLEYKVVSDLYEGYTDVTYLQSSRYLQSIDDTVGKYVYYMYEEKISEEDYEAAHTEFFEKHIKIPVTALELIDWDLHAEVKRSPEEMADALLNTSQAFIRVRIED